MSHAEKMLVRMSILLDNIVHIHSVWYQLTTFGSSGINPYDAGG